MLADPRMHQVESDSGCGCGSYLEGIINVEQTSLVMWVCTSYICPRQ